jgi:sec-independent protein translocase protein TatB
MLPDLSATHIMLLVVVALLVVGPKDLPALLRKIGQFMARLRGMANEFRASFDEMARQSELDELRKEVEAMRAAAAKPVSDLKDQVSGLIDQSTVSLDTPAPADFAQVKASDLAEPEPSILPPIDTAPISAPAAKSAKPKTVKATGSKSAPKSKPDGGKAKAAPAAKAAAPKKAPKKANAPSKSASKPKASPPVEPGA